MSLLTLIKIRLLEEMNDIEELFANMEERKPGNYVSTKEVVVRYTLNGQDRFFVIDSGMIHHLLKSRAETIRKEKADWK